MSSTQAYAPGADLDVVRLTRDLIEFDTMPETGDEAACLEFLAGLLRRAGFRVELDSFGARGVNLYAWLMDRPERPGLCLAGHIDTVSVNNGRWASDPLCATEKDGRIYGRGACDMKGGVAAMVCAAARARSRLASGQDLRLHVYGGEEVGCLGSAHMVRSRPGQLSRVGAVIVAEPTAMKPCVGHKGAVWLKVTANGRAAHGSMPQFGDNALSKAVAAARSLESYPIGESVHPHMGASTLTLTTLHSGSSHNSVPDSAFFTVDIRIVPGQDPQSVASLIREVVGPGCDVEILQSIHPLWTDPANPWIGRVAELVAEQVGGSNASASAPCITQFFTDGAALRAALPEVPILILGPGEPSLAHQTDEWCEVSELRRAESVYSTVIADWYGLRPVNSPL